MIVSIEIEIEIVLDFSKYDCLKAVLPDELKRRPVYIRLKILSTHDLKKVLIHVFELFRKYQINFTTLLLSIYC